MKEATEGSNTVVFDFECLTFGKDKEKGLKVVQGASKSTIFNEKMEIQTYEGELKANNELDSNTGRTIQFPEGTFKTIVKNNQQRKSIQEVEREI
jgi:hypothetical protein